MQLTTSEINNTNQKIVQGLGRDHVYRRKHLLACITRESTLHRMGEKSSTIFTKPLSPIPNAHTEYYLCNICTKVWQTQSLMKREYHSICQHLKSSLPKECYRASYRGKKHSCKVYCQQREGKNHPKPFITENTTKQPWNQGKKIGVRKNSSKKLLLGTDESLSTTCLWAEQEYQHQEAHVQVRRLQEESSTEREVRKL